MERPKELRQDLVKSFYELIYKNFVAVDSQLVRIGGANNGGYLVPFDLLAGAEACFSPGVSSMCDFDLDFVKITGKPLFALDGSVDVLKGGDAFPDLIRFDKAWLRYDEPNDGIEHLTLKEWVERCGKLDSNNLILQMDVEGAEWAVFLGESLDLLRKFTCIIVEIHNLLFVNNPEFAQIVESALSRVLSVFGVVHAHPNNSVVYARNGVNVYPMCMELTLINRFVVPHTLSPIDLSKGYAGHPLDSPNVLKNDEIKMPYF